MSDALQPVWFHPHSVILSEVARAFCELRSRRTPTQLGTNSNGGTFLPTRPQAFSPESYEHSWHNQHLRGPSAPSRIKPRDSAQDDSLVTSSKCNSAGLSRLAWVRSCAYFHRQSFEQREVSS
jgi:hypothetical protein